MLRNNEIKMLFLLILEVLFGQFDISQQWNKNVIHFIPLRFYLGEVLPLIAWHTFSHKLFTIPDFGLIYLIYSSYSYDPRFHEIWPVIFRARGHVRNKKYRHYLNSFILLKIIPWGWRKITKIFSFTFLS